MKTMRLGPKIRQLRCARGYSQQMVANAVGVAQNQVSKWESGKNTPHLVEMRALARLFEVSLDYLADDNSDDPPPPVTRDERDLLAALRRAGITPIRALEVLVRAGLIADPGPAREDDRGPGMPQRPDRRKPKRSGRSRVAGKRRRRS